jgi:hypothetical protein
MPSSIILPAVFGSAAAGIAALGTFGYAALGFAINMIASSILSKALGSDSPTTNDAQGNPNPGSRTQVPPAGDNKVPVIYGSAYIGGTITDLSITQNNQTLYYVLTLAECTNTEQGGTPDTYTFGNVYWGGKRVIFNSTNQYKVDALLDESTGIYDYSVMDKLEIYKYSNGSNSPVNSTQTAIQVMSGSSLVYKWNSTKLMSDCAFAIIKVTYSQRANLTGLQQTKFQLTNSRNKPGDCFLDYLTSARYGAAIPLSNVDTDSLDLLNTYSDGVFVYTPSSGGTYSSQARFQFDGVLDTTATIMQNLQLMSACCDCLIKYNEIRGLWGVIVQTPTVVPVMDINNSNMVSAIAISPIDLASSHNIAEVKFPDGTAKDSFNSAVFDLAVLDPALLYPNEPVNKQTISLPLVNNSVRAQYLATRFLKAAREDLQVQVEINYSGLQLEAGDVVTVTNSNYGWTAKQFRINKVVEKFSDDGAITAALSLMEFNASVYDDTDITEFEPAPNTGIGDPLFFGTLYAPIVTSLQPSITNPSFALNVTCASSGIVQYAEIWYSAFASPTDDQRIFAGTTAVNPGGNPFTPDASMGTVTLSSIPSGDWYFAVRMVNALGSSLFSSSSSVLRWRPTTFQYGERYLSIAYADDLNGTNISSSPRGKDYYGLKNASTYGYDTDPANYTWYLSQPTFGTSVYLLYSNRTGRKFSFASGFAGYAAGTAQFVPTATGTYDPSVWQALEDGTNYIDLDVRTGQLIETGTTNIGSGEIAITNNADGKVVASLAQLLDFGAGVQTLTGSATTVTIDIYGRVLGFTTPDGFYYTRYGVVATAGQTVFTPTARQANYIVGMDLVFRNGILLDTSEYTENSTTVTLGTGAAVGDQIVILSMRAISQGVSYINQYLEVLTVVGAVVTYDSSTLPYQDIVAGDIHTFTTAGSPTQYTVSAWNPATQQITYTASVTGVTAGAVIYQYRSSGMSYRPFGRFTTTLTNASSYMPTTWAIHSGYEKVFLNGTSVNDQDYDISGGSINTFPALATGLLTFIQFNDNNQTVPVGNQTSTATNTIVGTITYNYNFNADAFELYNNGSLQVLTDDYTLGSTSYTLTTSPTSNLNILQQTTYTRTGAA